MISTGLFVSVQPRHGRNHDGQRHLFGPAKQETRYDQAQQQGMQREHRRVNNYSFLSAETGVSWVPKQDAIVTALEGDIPRFYNGAGRRAFSHAAFGPLQEQQFNHGHTGSPEIAAEPELRGKAVVTVPYATAAFVAVNVS